MTYKAQRIEPPEFYGFGEESRWRQDIEDQAKETYRQGFRNGLQRGLVAAILLHGVTAPLIYLAVRG